LLNAPTAWRAARDAAVWPARFEVLQPAPLRDGQRLVLDVGHNEPAVEALLTSVSRVWGAPSRLVVIFGANFDKDVAKIVQLISAAPSLLCAIAVQSSHPKAVPTANVLNNAQSATASVARADAATWLEAPSMLQALRQAADAAGTESATILCCGSVFVVADMRAALAAEQPALFRHGDWAFDEAGEPPLLM